MATKVNRIGHCTVCDKKIADVVRWNENTGNPDVDGTPNQIGGFYDDTQHVTVLLTSGLQMTMDVCARCAPLVDDQMVDIWEKLCYAQGKTLDPEWLKAKGVLPLTEDQEHVIRRSLSSFVTDPPLGIFSVQSWGEMRNDRTRQSQE